MLRSILRNVSTHQSSGFFGPAAGVRSVRPGWCPMLKDGTSIPPRFLTGTGVNRRLKTPPNGNGARVGLAEQ